MNAKELNQGFEKLKAATFEAINAMFPAPTERFPDYVMLVFDVPVQKDYGTINSIIKDADGSLWLMDDNDAKNRAEDFPDLETIIFILGIMESKKYQVIE